MAPEKSTFGKTFTRPSKGLKKTDRTKIPRGGGPRNFSNDHMRSIGREGKKTETNGEKRHILKVKEKNWANLLSNIQTQPFKVKVKKTIRLGDHAITLI